MCKHLIQLDKALKAQGHLELSRGQSWSKNCREWVYYDCYLDIESLRKEFGFPDFIKHHENDDPKSGTEEGFVCELCNDGIMGLNRKYELSNEKKTFKYTFNEIH